MDLNQYLTITDICNLFQISRRTLERMRLDPSDPKFVPLRSGNGMLLEFPQPNFWIKKSPRWDMSKFQIHNLKG